MSAQALARTARALWSRVQEPRVVTTIQWVVYGITLTVGVIALVEPPGTVEGALGPLLATIWAGFLVLGGMLGVVAVLPGIWWLERAAVLACITGLAIYGSVVLTLHVQAPTGNRLPQAGVIAIAAAHFATRWFRIRRYAYDPEATARRLK